MLIQAVGIQKILCIDEPTLSLMGDNTQLKGKALYLQFRFCDNKKT
jgi:hypothetical protein